MQPSALGFRCVAHFAGAAALSIEPLHHRKCLWRHIDVGGSNIMVPHALGGTKQRYRTAGGSYDMPKDSDWHHSKIT